MCFQVFSFSNHMGIFSFIHKHAVASYQKDIEALIELYRPLEKRKEAESEVNISQENVLLSIIPTKALGDKLEELSQKIKNLETVNLKTLTEDVSTIIEENEKNFRAPGIKVREIIETLLISTIKTEVVSMVRSLSLDVKRAQGYTVYNRGREEVKEKKVDTKELKEKLERIVEKTESKNFDIGIESLNRYIKSRVKKLLEDL